MKSRERVKRAISFGGPDKVPVSHAILPAAQFKYGERLTEILDGVWEDFGWHLLPDMKREDLPPLYRLGRNRDDFGTVWDVRVEGMCGIPVVWPLADWDDYDDYEWPELSAGPPTHRLYSGHMSGFNEEYYARGAWITFFETMQQLRGMENLFADLALGDKRVWRLRDDFLELNLRWIDRWLEHEYDGLSFADDWGAQQNLLISPDLWDAFFKPCYAKMFDKVKAAGLDVHFHTDGNIRAIVGDLIDLGVDVLNCQSTVIGQDFLKKNFAGKVTFRTDIDRQHVMTYASPAELKEHVFRLFADLGTPDGGIIASGDIGPDTPLENIRAMYEAFGEFSP